MNPYIANRLRNEAATLRFIAEHTTIPVPKMLGLWVENDVLHLKTSLVPDHAISLSDVDDSVRPVAIKRVGVQLESWIFPQLLNFRRNFLGSVDKSLPVIPPRTPLEFQGESSLAGDGEVNGRLRALSQRPSPE